MSPRTPARPECENCGSTTDLRVACRGYGKPRDIRYVPPVYICSDCYTPASTGGEGDGGRCAGVIDGPGFDELDPAGGSAAPEPVVLTEPGQAWRLLQRGWTLVLGFRHRVALAPGVPVPDRLLNAEEARD